MLLHTILSAFALFFSIIACVVAVRGSVMSISLRKITRIQAELTDQADSLASLHEMLRTLRSRIGMRELRARRKGAKNEPEQPEYDMTTEAGRTQARYALEAELARDGRLHSRAHQR
jgi:hypothetical protein